jgi:hypothetical protein
VHAAFRSCDFAECFQRHTAPAGHHRTTGVTRSLTLTNSGLDRAARIIGGLPILTTHVGTECPSWQSMHFAGRPYQVRKNRVD